MRQKLDPDLEFDWGPTLWAAATVFVFGLIANFVVMRPGWIGHGAFLAGVVASFRSGYYDASGNNAALGVLLGVLLLTPILVYTRIVFFFGIEEIGDTIFASIALGTGWLIIVIMILVPVGYIGAIVSDFTRKKVGGPIGF